MSAPVDEWRNGKQKKLHLSLVSGRVSTRTWLLAPTIAFGEALPADTVATVIQKTLIPQARG